MKLRPDTYYLASMLWLVMMLLSEDKVSRVECLIGCLINVGAMWWMGK